MKVKYKTLGLKKGASQKEIQEAYERLTKKLDPEGNNNDPFFEEQLAKVKAAFEALSQHFILSNKEGGNFVQDYSKEREKKNKHKNKNIGNDIPVKELNWFLKIFTIGDKFSLQDFLDRAKKMVVEFFAIFFGVFLSLAVDQKRENSNHRSDNINNMKKLKVELQDILVYTDEYIEGVTWFYDLFQRQYDRWGENSDSVFLDIMGEGDDAYAFAPLSFYEQAMPYDPPKVAYESVQLDGTFRFLDDTLEHELTQIYSGSTLFYIKENAYARDQAIVDDFVSRISDRWVEELGDVKTQYNYFWEDNREYIQNDYYINHNVFRRLGNFNQITDQLLEHKASVEGAISLLDSILKHKEEEFEIIYWVVDFDFLHKE